MKVTHFFPGCLLTEKLILMECTAQLSIFTPQTISAPWAALPALPAWGSAEEGMGWSWWANTVKGWCSWQNEGSGAELALAELSALDHLASQSQREQQILQLCPPNTSSYPQTRLQRHLWSAGWSLTGRREEEAKIIAFILPFSSCLFSTLTIYPPEYTQHTSESDYGN